METKTPDLIQYVKESNGLTLKFYLEKRVNIIDIYLDARSICTVRQNINIKGDTQPATVNWWSWGDNDAETTHAFSVALKVASDLALYFDKGLEHPYIAQAKLHGEYYYADQAG